MKLCPHEPGTWYLGYQQNVTLKGLKRSHRLISILLSRVCTLYEKSVCVRALNVVIFAKRDNLNFHV